MKKQEKLLRLRRPLFLKFTFFTSTFLDSICALVLS